MAIFDDLEESRLCVADPEESSPDLFIPANEATALVARRLDFLGLPRIGASAWQSFTIHHVQDK